MNALTLFRIASRTTVCIASDSCSYRSRKYARISGLLVRSTSDRAEAEIGEKWRKFRERETMFRQYP